MFDTRYLYKAKYNNIWVKGAYLKFLPYTPSPVRDYDIPDKDYRHLVFTEGFSDWNLPRDIKVYEIDVTTLCQCTGITDKNNVLIWEHDIVRSNSFEAEVVWFNNGFCLKSNDVFVGYMKLTDDIEVIRNRFD